LAVYHKLGNMYMNGETLPIITLRIGQQTIAINLDTD